MKINNCFMLTSNKSSWIAPIFIESKSKDRRYTIVGNKNSKNLRKDNLWSQKDFNDWDKGYLQKVLMKYIYNLPEDKSISLNYGIDNEFKSEIQQRCQN